MVKGKRLARKQDTKNVKGNLYIFCEGKKTEALYFDELKSDICKGRCFRKKLPEIKIIPSNNCGAIANIGFIKSYVQNNSLSEKDGDCTICIIDCDANKSQDLEKAIQMAIGDCGLKVHICLSNPSFELWYLLHFEYYTQPLDQQVLEKRLKRHIPDYEKKKGYYKELLDYFDTACDNAYRLRSCHSKNKVKLLSIESNPSTMVPYFIEKINDFISGD